MAIKSDKIIFLDIDGVLNSLDNMRSMTLLKKYVTDTVESRDDYGHFFDERCVRWLQYIIKQTGADIVVASAWSNKGLETIQQMWEERELPGVVIDVCRHDAQWDWMEKNNYKDKFVIISDDMTESIVVVKPFGDVGITLKDVHKAVTVLNG